MSTSLDESRLAYAPRTDQRQQAMVTSTLDDVRYVTLTADKCSARDRKVVELFAWLELLDRRFGPVLCPRY